MNLPSRLEEACLFFLLGEKKLASLWQQCQQQPDFCCAEGSSSTTTTLLRFVLSFWFLLLSCPAFSIIPVKKKIYTVNIYATNCNKRYQIYRILICSICKWISIINFEVQWMKQWNTVNCLSYSRGTWESHNFEYFLSQISLCCIDVTTTKEWIRLNCKK